jgi:pimeloyl-ACP methyl ester carboxylesterase
MMEHAELEVVEAGSGDDLVVLVHGVLDRGRSFRRVAENLAPDFRILSYDRRGYGDAATDTSGVPVDVDRHITDLLAILDGRRAIVVGHSFGGVIALGAAARAPDLVAGVMVWETSIAWAPGWDDTIMGGVFADSDPEEAALRLMLGDRYEVMDDDRRAILRRQAAAFLAEEQSVRSGMPPYDLGAVRSPVVYGRSDLAMMPAVVDYLRARLPRFEVATVDGADHHAHRSTPEAFADLVRRAGDVARP